MPPDQEIEIKGYFGKYIEDHFKHIDDTVTSLKESMDKSTAGIKGDIADLRGQFIDLRNEVKEEVAEVKADNKAGRRWILGVVVGTGIAVLFGIAAIFFSFAQIQTSWMQQVITFALKAMK
jgi:uncharacterized membrane protein YcjF (UPF0283 family)